MKLVDNANFLKAAENYCTKIRKLATKYCQWITKKLQKFLLKIDYNNENRRIKNSKGLERQTNSNKQKRKTNFKTTTLNVEEKIYNSNPYNPKNMLKS